MLITDLPNEMILMIVYKLNYIDVLNLYGVSKQFKHLIDKYLFRIYCSFEKKSIELCWRPWDDNYKYWNKPFNYTIFSKIYTDAIKKKKQALIVIKYIYKWIVNELIDSPMDRSAVPTSMAQAIYLFLTQLCPNKKNDIDKEFKYIGRFRQQHGWEPWWLRHYRFVKQKIEKYVSEDQLNYMNVSRLTVDGFQIYEKFNFDNPDIYLYNKNFTKKHKYEIKINKYDIRMFDIY